MVQSKKPWRRWGEFVCDEIMGWVLYASMPYVKSDQTSVFTTGLNRLFVFGAPETFAGAGFANTGLNSNWTTAGATCNAQFPVSGKQHIRASPNLLRAAMD